jgi:hypothetical protein
VETRGGDSVTGIGAGFSCHKKIPRPPSSSSGSITRISASEGGFMAHYFRANHSGVKPHSALI